MNIIDKFIIEYDTEYPVYKQLAQLAHDELESEVINRGIKAIITNRAKRPERLKEKIQKRNVEKKYKSKKAIYNDIVDLVGVRVALYFPSERDIVGKVIEEIFQVVETKSFPPDPYKPKYNKRFSGYWATHYRVKLKETDKIPAKFINRVFEIQIASVLMLAWSEVEHDLVYKPFTGELSDEELSILDEINGLVIAGEIALERLQKAMSKRTRKQLEISSKYDLTNMLFSNYQNIHESKPDFGNTEYINNYLRAVEKIKTTEIIESLKNINTNIKETFSDQFLSNIISLNQPEVNDNLRKYLGYYTNNEQKVLKFESFVKLWFIFIRTIYEIAKENNLKEEETTATPFIFRELIHLTDEEISQIEYLRLISYQLTHGDKSFTNTTLDNSYQQLEAIVMKSIKTIRDQKVKDLLTAQIQ